jgi:hypothetical protein
MRSKIITVTTIINEVTDSRFVCVDFDRSFEKEIIDFARENGRVTKNGTLTVNSPLWYQKFEPMVVVRAYPATKKAGHWVHAVKQLLNSMAIITVVISLQVNQNQESVIVAWYKNIRPSVPNVEQSESFAKLVQENIDKPLTVFERTNTYIGSTPLNSNFVEPLF